MSLSVSIRKENFFSDNVVILTCQTNFCFSRVQNQIIFVFKSNRVQVSTTIYLIMAPRTPKTPKTPSKVGSQSEWKYCSSCDSTFSSKDSPKHETSCSHISCKQFSHEFVQHGFVLDKELHAVIQETSEKEPEFKFKIERSNLVLMSVAAMQLCGIEIGSCVVAEVCGSPGLAAIFTAWPSKTIHPASVSINNEGNYFEYLPQKNAVHASSFICTSSQGFVH